MPAVVLVALAAIAAHVRSLTAPFFADDWLFLDQVRGRSLFAALASPDPIGNYFRPLGRQVWFSVLGVWSGESPFVFHAANLVCLVLAIVLLARIARRAAGPAAGVIAAAFLALHYAADVPVLWASGSQELLSLTLVLAALDLQQRGARLAGAGVFLAALLAKEAVVLAPVAALALDPEGGTLRTRVQRGWPWLAAVGVWVAIAALASASRGTAGAGLHLTPLAPLAVPVLLARVAIALEWVRGAAPWSRWIDPGAGGWLALLAATAAVLWIAPAGVAPRTRKSADARVSPGPWPVVRTGLLWALAGALPVVAVAPLWSAYYFLFALAGVGLALGAALASRPAPLAAAAVLALGLASNEARGLQEFATAPSAWSGQSHVNRFYLERGMSVISRGIADLRRQMPKPEPRTTVFVAGLPSFAAFQVADGPLVRGVYRDSTLRGYYLSQLTRERLQRGPWRLFFYKPALGQLVDETHTPGVLLSTALGMVLNGQIDVAEAALQAAASNGEPDMGHRYVTAWVAYDRGDRARVPQLLRESGRTPAAGAEVAVRDIRARLGARDTLGAIIALRSALVQHALDPALHAIAADVLLTREDTRSEGEVEAYAARLLTPDDPLAWRRWAQALTAENRPDLAITALDHYRGLGPALWDRDTAAQRLRALLERVRPGGDLAQRELKRELKP